MAKQRRPVTLISVAFLDVLTNYSGAILILLLLFISKKSSKPYQEFKYNAHASIDLQQGVLFDLDTTRLANLHTGQQILITIKDFKHLAIEGCPPYNPYTGPRYKEHKECVCPPPCPPIGCTIVGYAKPSKCKDDIYTDTIIIKQAGDCGTGWKSPSGYSGLYNQPFVATFRGSEGNKAIKIIDNKNPATTCYVNIMPPDCNIPAEPGKGKGEAGVGLINFKMTWQDENARINLYVQKDGKQWIKAISERKAWGKITQTTASGVNKTFYPEEQFIQDKKVEPGTYQVYGHYKGIQDSKKVKQERLMVSLSISSKSHPEQNRTVQKAVSLQNKAPNSRSGGGTYLATVVVSADGSIQLK